MHCVQYIVYFSFWIFNNIIYTYSYSIRFILEPKSELLLLPK